MECISPDAPMSVHHGDIWLAVKNLLCTPEASFWSERINNLKYKIVCTHWMFVWFVRHLQCDEILSVIDLFV